MEFNVYACDDQGLEFESDQVMPDFVQQSLKLLSLLKSFLRLLLSSDSIYISNFHLFLYYISIFISGLADFCFYVFRAAICAFLTLAIVFLGMFPSNLTSI